MGKRGKRHSTVAFLFFFRSRKVDREAYAKRDSCASLSKLEWRMHDYFAKIGGDMGIGGGGGTNISLFELPVLLEGTGKQLYAIRQVLSPISNGLTNPPI